MSRILRRFELLLPLRFNDGLTLTGTAPLTKLKPKWSWLQFSLRTMLVLVGALCVALNVWIVPSERQRRAVAAIEALHGRVSYVAAQPTRESFQETFLRRWLPQTYFHDVIYVVLENAHVTDAELAHVQGLTGLQRLYLTNTHISDNGLTHLQGLTRLQRLYLIDAQITDAGLTHLRGLAALERLCLTNTQVTDAGLAHLQGIPGLRFLILDNTQITDTGLAHLQSLRGLQGLSLQKTKVTDSGLALLRAAIPNCHIEGP